MAKYLIQAYSRNMTEKYWEENKEFERIGVALSYAYSQAYHDWIVALWVLIEKDPNRFILIAKFY